MKSPGKNRRLLAGLLVLLLLCGCSRVRVPEEELQAAGRPVEGIPADPRPDPDPDVPTRPEPESQPVLKEGFCALLPGRENTYVLYDRWGKQAGMIPSEDTDLAGVYSADSIVAGYRLSDGSPVLPDASAEAQWVQDDTGFSVYDPQAGLLYRLDTAGELQFFCSVPAGAAYVSLLPLGRDFLFSIWSGSGTDADPWKLLAPCAILNETGGTEQDLSFWISAPVLGVLGGETLLLARPGDTMVDAYDRSGRCLGQGLRLIREAGAQQALGGVLCNSVWKDGWICSVGLQPQLTYPDPGDLTLCGDHAAGISYDIDGISSNGELLICGGEAAVWGVEQDVLAIQWQGINYHFPAGTRRYERLQRCSRELAVSYTWDEDGGSSFRLLFLDTGSVLEYHCPADARSSALLGEGYALFATTYTDAATGEAKSRFWVVDTTGTLRYESTEALLPCAGSCLLRREEAGVSLLNLDGTVLIPPPEL